MRVFLLLLFCAFLGAAENKIVGVVPFGDNHLKLVFEQNIDDLTLLQKRFDSRHIIDFFGNLRHGKREFTFKNGAKLEMAQNAPDVIRVVVRLKDNQRVEVEKVDKSLYIRTFGDVKNAESKSVDAKKKAESKSVDSKKTAESKSADAKKPADVKKPAAQKTDSKKQDSKDVKDANKSVESKQPAPPPPPKKVIVIDPGHGGSDCGALGYYQVCEKIIVLNLSRILVNELKKRGYVVYLTRKDDEFIDLLARTEFANKKGADLFISIHANSIEKGKESPFGIETYFLSTARSERAKKVAETENQGDVEIMNHFSKETFLETINSHRLLASNKLAIDVQFGMLQRAKKMYHDAKDGGVREGPFWVLAGALMPSILIEIGYTSHKIEGQRIRNKNYQRLLALGIADGVDGYFEKNE